MYYIFAKKYIPHFTMEYVLYFFQEVYTTFCDGVYTAFFFFFENAQEICVPLY
jgi:hypothetical protein